MNNDFSFSATAKKSDTFVAPDDCLSAIDVLSQAKNVLEMEKNAISEIIAHLDKNFEQAITLLAECKGKVIVTGIGKSGHIGNKIAATFASTGTPAFFVHSAELHHGDFGAIDGHDLVLAISSSGETAEIRLALDHLKRLGLKIIALTGNTNSTLAKFADVVLDIGVSQEACPFNLAPTASTTATLAMGDAIAIVLMMQKGFTVKDFAKSHPGGTLGKQLLTVNSIMRSGTAIPITLTTTGYDQVLTEIESKKLGFTSVCSSDNKLVGIITDGDLRRAIVKYGKDVFAKSAIDLMTTGAKTIKADSLAVEALHIMEQYSISDLLITDDNNTPIGVIDLKDLLKAGII
jgi:arabinose-5-phosphate isomerase